MGEEERALFQTEGKMSRSFGQLHSSIYSSLPHVLMPSLIPVFLFTYESPSETSSVRVVSRGMQRSDVM